MKISTGWPKNVQPDDRTALLALITTGDQEVDPKTSVMIEQYKQWTSDLTEGEMEQVITLLGRGLVLGRGIAEELQKELVDRRDPLQIKKRAEALQARQETLAAAQALLLKQGLDSLGGAGATWDGRRDQINAWWRELKAAEEAETWASAFAANRMSARQVNTNSVLGGEFAIRNKSHRLDREWDRKIVLDRTLAGVRARIVPANFNVPTTGVNRKNELGLHDLSASLLDGTRAVNAQLKPYAAATVVFMPVPTERNAQIFNAIESLTPVTEADRKLLRTMRNSFTRLRLAQATDMHTYLLNVNGDKTGEPMVRYGHSGLIRRTGDKAEVRVDDIDIATRRTNALQHSVVLLPSTQAVVNEVVMVYRQHASALFPAFAKWDQIRSRFTVLNRDTGAATKPYISDDGKWVTG
jgi:hypothetical protein